MSEFERIKDEIKLAGLLDSDSAYDGMIGQALMDLSQVFCSQGHSGMSASLTSGLFKKLIDGDVLTPLSGDRKSNEWVEVTDSRRQNKRCSHCFWDDKDDLPYTIEGRAFSDDKGESYYTSKDSRVNFEVPGYPPKTEYVTLSQGEKIQ